MKPAAPMGSSLRASELVLAGVALSALVALGLVLLFLHERGRHEAEEQRRNVLMSAMFADTLARQVDSVALALTGLGELVQDLEPDGGKAQAERLAERLAQTEQNLPFLRGLLVIDAQGLVLASPVPQALGRRIELARLGALPEPGQAMLLDFQLGRHLFGPRGAPTQQVGFLPLVRSFDGPAGRRHVLALINLAALTTLQEAALRDQRTTTAILSPAGHLLSAPREVQLPLGAAVTAAAKLQQSLPHKGQGTWVGAGLREGSQIVAFQLVRNWPLVVWVESGRAAAQAQGFEAARPVLFGGVVALLVLGWTARTAVRSLRARLRAQHARDLAQAHALQRERELALTVQSLQELVFRTDAAGQLLFSNGDLALHPAARAEGPGGLPLWECFDLAGSEALRAFVVDPPTVPVSRLRLTRTIEGLVRHFELNLQALRQDGVVIGLAGSAIDVTERWQAQERLRAQLDFTRQLMAISPLPKSVCDLQGRYRIVNRAWEQFTGRSQDSVVGELSRHQLPPAVCELHGRMDDEVIRTGLPVRYEVQQCRADGSLRDVVVNKLLVPPEGGGEPLLMAVLMDVTEFREAERATAEARDAAERALQTRSAFVANITHELRTPLQSILGFSELGLARSGEQDRFAQMFGTIHAAGQHMLGLVSDLLDLSKAEQGFSLGERSAVELPDLAQAAAGELEAVAQARGMRIALAPPPAGAMRVWVDPVRLRQVLRNVLANATRFGPPNSVVALSWLRQPDAVGVRVCDRGPGVPETELEAIFQPFVQSSRTRDGAGGTGLGLAIARQILAAHGGRVQAFNRGEGGASFEIWLPRAQPERAPCIADMAPACAT